MVRANNWKKVLVLMLVAVLGLNVVAQAEPKNVIFFVGDGMGPEHVKAGGMYAYGAAGTLSFESFSYNGELTTYSANASVTDSAAAATALATGIKVNNGVISGRFPTLIVEDGDEFHAVIGCLFDALACDMTMQLNYRADGGVLTPLREWDETYDGEFRAVEVDLSSLAGSSVEFVLAVQANGPFNEDWAFWLAPRIVGIPR